MTKKLKQKLSRNCSICGRRMRIYHYADRTYRGGHYFGTILPDHGEYWECPTCYWHIKDK
ncbi:MAG: hypothetical protein AAB932_03935 [Patescibacteria group bacterium]